MLAGLPVPQELTEDMKHTMNTPEIAILIPAYNEASTIEGVVKKALIHSAQVIVVNDCSTDETATKLAQLSVTVINHETNQGKAASLMTGIEYALQQPNLSAVITLDGDAQHDPNDIPLMLAAATAHAKHIIIAARLNNRQQAPRARRYANNIADLFIGWAAGTPIVDSQSGFRYYPRDVLEHINLSHDKKHAFVFESEVLIESVWQGYNIAAIPIASCYPADRRASYFNPSLDVTKIVWMVSKRLFKRFMHLGGLLRSITRRPTIFRA